MPEHQPGEPASASGFYHEVNVFGSPTGRTVLDLRHSCIDKARRRRGGPSVLAFGAGSFG